MFLFFEGFQRQNVLILLFYSIKHSYLILAKTCLALIIHCNWRKMGDIEYFNTALEQYRYSSRVVLKSGTILYT